MLSQPQHEQTAGDIDEAEAPSPSAQQDSEQPHTPETSAQELKTVVTTPNYEATLTAEEAPLLARLMENAGIDPVQFVHDNGDVTFSFAASERDTVEKLITTLRTEQSKAVSATQAAASPRKPGRSRPELNYRNFEKMFPEITSGEYRYLELAAGEGMMPLHLEWIGGDVIAVSHTYTQNGDLMRDPEMTFRIDRENGTLLPLTFQQDGYPSIYQEVYPEPGIWSPKLSKDLSRFAQTWLKNIREQGYLKHEAVIVRDGEDVRLTFDQDGRAVEPEPPEEPPVSAPLAVTEADIEAALQEWNGDIDSKRRVQQYMTDHAGEADTAEWLKNEYGDDFPAYPVNGEKAATDISWSEVQHHLSRLVREGRFLSESEIDTPERGDGAVIQNAPAQEPSPITAGQPKPAVETVSPVTLYEEALNMLESVIKQSSLYSFLRDQDTDYDQAKGEVDAEISFYMEQAAGGYPDIMYAFRSLPMFRQWLSEDILERNYMDYGIDYRIAPERYADMPDAPDWARKSAVIEIPLEPETVPEAIGADAPEQTAGTDTAPAEPNLTPNVEEYLNLKVQYPDKLIGVQVGDYMLFYGKDAEEAAYALGAKLQTREIPGLGNTFVTGSNAAWQATLKKLLEHGKSVVLAQPDPERGPDAPYEIIKERDAAEYIPLGMELTIDGRHMRIDSIDFDAGTVSMLDLDLQGWFPIFRSEPISFVREYVEEEQNKQQEQARESEDFSNINPAEVRAELEKNGIVNGEVVAPEALEHSPFIQEVMQTVEQASHGQETDKGAADTPSASAEHDTADDFARERMAETPVPAAPTEQDSPAPDEPEAAPELVEVDGGQIAESPAQQRNRREAEREVSGRVFPSEIILQPLRFGPEQYNFHITDDNLGVGGEKTKYQYNVAAIRTLKQIEAEGRLATPEEQEILSRYVGWGGIAHAFDPNNQKWAKEYAELQELMTPEEYDSARRTVVNAHYTSPAVIKAIYQAVERMDFKPGTVLEPSMGIGNFFGFLPEKLADAKLHGVELDSLTGRIARQLYQKADITVDGFENTDYPDNSFDLAVGNVPFGEYAVHDKRYDRQNLLIHDYFITKTLDKVRPGGIVAFVTTKGTMDKKNSKVREALAQKADLLGAIRLPNNAFKANAGTEVTTDILFFQKRDGAPEKLPEWVESGQTTDGVPLNRYFLEHPEMVLGKMSFWKNMYGNETETACLPIEGADLTQQLAEAVQQISPPNRELLELDAPEPEQGKKIESIPADLSVRNFSYTLSGGKLYFRENSRMNQVELGKAPTERVKGMIAIRDSARKLIDLQMRGGNDQELETEQKKLNQLYDKFTKEYGLISSPGNRLAFRKDSSYPLLCSLEVLDDKGNLTRKADMFTKRTIRHHEPVTSVDTAAEALAVSIGERACVDLGFMASLMGGGEKIPQIVKDLQGVIFKDPNSGPFDIDEGGTNWYKGWQTADEYLSGNVRKKLIAARAAAEQYPEFAINVEKLEQVQPKELTAAEIDVHIGAPWVKPEYYRQFLFELLKTPWQLQDGKIDVRCAKTINSIEWNIKGKNEDKRDNPLVISTYGTKRRNAYSLFEDALNLRDARIYDTIYEDGKEKRVLNQKETMIAQQKQEAIGEAFRNWIFKDPERRADLCATYNRLFNSTRPREYNGDHIQFAGMNPEYKLEPHQRNAVARMLYGGNTLLAHCVGAGKTFEMIAAAMEGKRLGLNQKSLFVVPNHLTEQWGGDFLTLYPGAKVLVATKEDFKPANRKKFCARIATGDYDAVVIGHSQFEKIPLSTERQKRILKDQIKEIMTAIREAKDEKAERWSIKQMEKTKLNLEAKLKKLNSKKKDDTVTFEELGVDRLFVDEAHYYKNLYMHTKMRNVAGISQTEAQKSSDMFAKCRYMDEITGGKGITFATGTPISNSMVELYTMMRFLQFELLEEKGLNHFDSWAPSFGEKVTAIELKPEGTGFRAKTRFARFFNLPELMSLWKEATDIQTADMLKLPVPEAEYITISTEPTEAQKEMVQALAKCADKVRSGTVKPTVDNLLKITSDGRKLALDQRIANPLLPDDPGSKVNACVANVFKIWQESAEMRGTQLIFSDLSTPKGKAEQKPRKGKEDDTEQEPEDAVDLEAVRLETSVYEDIRDKLIAKGVPPEEIAFIHQANTEAQKEELFSKVRDGKVRILLGSTQKMGAGTNVQKKLIASHDLDCPWRPADLEQRAGRIIRRGNDNEKVQIFRYVTKGTFDAYNWGLVENKQKFIGQVMTSKSPARSIEDVDATALSYAEVKMIATGDPRIKEKMDLDIQVAKLKLLKANYMSQKYEMEDMILKGYPRQIGETEMYIRALTADLPILQAHPVKEDTFSMTIQGKTYTERKEAGLAIVAACKTITDPKMTVDLGEYRGFPMQLRFDGNKFKVTMKQNLTYTAELSDDVVGNIIRINNALEKIPQNLEGQNQRLDNLRRDLETAKEELARPFPQEEELGTKSARLSQLNIELDSDKSVEEPAQTGEAAPARDTSDKPVQPTEKQSILQALKDFKPSAPVRSGMDRSQRREAVR